MAEIEFQPGDVIQPLSRPFVKIVMQTHKGQLCDNCLKPGRLFRCNGCQKMHYCMAKCQKRDWKEGHSVECKSEVFKQLDFNNLDKIPVILRIVAKFHLKPDSFTENHAVYDGSQRSFNDMISHEDTFSDQTSRSLAQVFTTLRNDDSSFGAVDFDEAFLKRIFGIWKTNNFGILNMEETETVAVGLFITHSVFDHSCRPNATYVTRKGKMEVRCIHPIRRGETPVVSYIDSIRSPEQRRSDLESRYNFTCACELCTAEISRPLIDYRKMEMAQPKIRTPSYQAILKYRNRELEQLRRIYNEYDQRITAFCKDVFYDICQFQICFKRLSKPVLRKQAMDVEKRLAITFGKESASYIRFQQNCDKLEIKLASEI